MRNGVRTAGDLEFFVDFVGFDGEFIIGKDVTAGEGSPNCRGSWLRNMALSMAS